MSKSRAWIASGLLALCTAMPVAAQSLYTATLTGPSENPANGSTATGSVLVTVDNVLMTMRFEATFAGLVGGAATAAHIHCCGAAPANSGVAIGMPGFPAATSGSYDHSFDVTDSTIYNATFLANVGGGTALGSFNALLAGLNAGTAYFNIHDGIYPGGEIRGFLHAIPEPQTYALLALGLGAVTLVARRRRAH